MKTPHLKQIEAIRPIGRYRLAVTWRDGRSAIVDFSSDVKMGGIWSSIAPEEKFALVRVGRHGRVAEWPDPADDDGEPLIDVDADAMYALAMKQMAEPVFEAVLDHIRRTN